jgi:hypothetical protein
MEDVLDLQGAEPSIHFLPVPVPLNQNKGIKYVKMYVKKH